MEKIVNSNGITYSAPCTNGCDTDGFMSQKLRML